MAHLRISHAPWRFPLLSWGFHVFLWGVPRFIKGFPEGLHSMTWWFPWTYPRASWRISLISLSIYIGLPNGSFKIITDFLKDSLKDFIYFPWGLSQEGPKDFFDFLGGFIDLLKWYLKDFTSFLNGSIDFPEGLLKGCVNFLRDFIGLRSHFRTPFTCSSRISLTFPRISNASLRGLQVYQRVPWRISLNYLRISMDLPKGFLKDFIALLKHLQGRLQWIP